MIEGFRKLDLTSEEAKRIGLEYPMNEKDGSPTADGRCNAWGLPPEGRNRRRCTRSVHEHGPHVRHDVDAAPENQRVAWFMWWGNAR